MLRFGSVIIVCAAIAVYLLALWVCSLGLRDMQLCCDKLKRRALIGGQWQTLGSLGEHYQHGGRDTHLVPAMEMQNCYALF
jgi:hypothetical protein